LSGSELRREEVEVTELTQPLAAASAETTVARDAATRSTTFSELVYVHFAWWRALRGDTLGDAVRDDYHRSLAGFERRHGEIVSAYWCSQVESAVALTYRPRTLWRRAAATFHRETDWATRDDPAIAAELHRCDELAVRARTVLSGVRQLICMQLVMACAAHLLSLVDARAADEDDERAAAALAREREALARVEEYYDNAANGQAQLAYFAGMAVVAGALAAAATVWLVLDWATPVAALLAGALGGVVSVIQRINSGTFSLEYDVGRSYAAFLGGLRPLIGGAFAVVISFAFTGGLVNLPLDGQASADSRRLALIVVSFLAGFSERWAQDTLAAAMPAGGKAT
jgi:hypothetical protein